METLKHKHITSSLIEQHAETLCKKHLDVLYRMEWTSDRLDEKYYSGELINLLERLYRFGVNGRLFEGDMLPMDFEDIEKFAALEEVYQQPPFRLPGEKALYLITTIQLAAEARLELAVSDGVNLEEIYSLDEYNFLTFGVIELSQLAAIADVSVQSIRNDISKNKAQLHFIRAEELPFKPSKGRSYVSVEEAKAWLKGRHSFKPTMDFWEVHKREQAEESYYVPVAKDGSYFSERCRMTRGFQVGEKGKEVYIESFKDALSELTVMPLAKWRRPNQKGNFGIVTASEWKFVKKEDVLKK